MHINSFLRVIFLIVSAKNVFIAPLYFYSIPSHFINLSHLLSLLQQLEPLFFFFLKPIRRQMGNAFQPRQRHLPQILHLFCILQTLLGIYLQYWSRQNIFMQLFFQIWEFLIGLRTHFLLFSLFLFAVPVDYLHSWYLE